MDGGVGSRHKDLLEKLNGEGALAHTPPTTSLYVGSWSDHERGFLGSERAHLTGVPIVADFSIAHRYPGACGGAKGNLSHLEITL